MYKSSVYLNCGKDGYLKRKNEEEDDENEYDEDEDKVNDYDKHRGEKKEKKLKFYKTNCNNTLSEIKSIKNIYSFIDEGKVLKINSISKVWNFIFTKNILLCSLFFIERDDIKSKFFCNSSELAVNFKFHRKIKILWNRIKGITINLSFKYW